MLPQTPFLVPGYGAQGATADACRPCLRSDGAGAVINASRSVIYAFGKAGATGSWQDAVSAAAQAFARDVGRLLLSR
jgi:orotidine-5'-phosphate decarboxylase